MMRALFRLRAPRAWRPDLPLLDAIREVAYRVQGGIPLDELTREVAWATRRPQGRVERAIDWLARREELPVIFDDVREDEA